MGPIHVTVNVGNLAKDPSAFEAAFLSDTGAIDGLIPASALRAAGIGVEGRGAYELANGGVMGFARVAFMGSETVAQVIFGPEDCEPILGVAALENTGVGVDPVSRGLKRMAAKPLQ
jgi:predicted aspartyl protease